MSKPSCQCFAAGTVIDGADVFGDDSTGSWLGRRVETWKPREAGYAASLATSATDFAAVPQCVIAVVQEADDGHLTEALFLRPLDWLDGAVEGDWVELALPEIGADDPFQVMAIREAAPVQPGPGRVVTAEFRHWRGVVD